MKKITLITLLLYAVSHSIHAQAPLPVTGGLRLHLDAASGFNSGSPAVWTDISGSGNHLNSGGAGTDPVHMIMAPGTNFAAVQFDGIDDFMENVTPNSGWSWWDGVTEATLFVVRMADPASHSINTTPANFKTLISIAEDHSIDNEFGLLSDVVHHHTIFGHWYSKDHQCYSSLTNAAPVVLTGQLFTGTSNSDIEYYVNNLLTTQTANYPGAIIGQFPSPYTAANRMIVLGARYRLGTLDEFFDGHIFEVLAYNRALNATEISDVNEWLMAKYDVDGNSGCNGTIPNSSQDCFTSPQLDVVFTGIDPGTGDCTFSVTAHAATSYTITHYEWQIPGMSPFTHTTSSTTSTQTFTLPANTSNNTVSVKVFAYNGSTTPGNFCCEVELTRNVNCDNAMGGSVTGYSN